MAKIAPAEFTVGDVFEIKGRGLCISRDSKISKERYDAGERWTPGDVAVCAETGQAATIVGVEHHAVAPDHPAYFDGSLLLRPIGPAQLELAVGQSWQQVKINPTCRTCIHWCPTILDDHDSDPAAAAAGATPEERADAVWGTCTLIGADHDGYEGAAARANPAIAAYTSDGSNYWSALHTRPSFGCTNHKAVSE